MIKLFIYLAILAVAFSATPDQWRSKTIYQVLTDRFARTNGSTTPCQNLSDYCGGTFQGIINNLNYIAGMGFDAIWISPVVANTQGGYHGYWAQNFSQINPYFGSQQDLLNLVKAAHAKGMWVMLDVVANHVGPVSFNFTQIFPFSNTSNYHSYCIINNWNNQTEVEYCRLAGLPDLAQEDPTTRKTLLNWVSNIVKTYGFDGLRVDTVPEVPSDFWVQYTQAAGVYTIGEVFNGNMNYVASYQGPLSGVLNYPLYFTIRSVFQSGQSMYNLQNYFQQAAATYFDYSLLGTFVDNHDNPRFLYQNGDVIMFKAALAFSLTTVGIPIVYYGDEQGFSGGPDPGCREPLWTSMNTSAPIYQYIKTIIAFRKQTQFYWETQVQRWADDNFYAFTRGPYFFAFTNSHNQQERNITYHPYSDGMTLCNIFWNGDCVTVQNGQFSVYLDNGEVKIFVPKYNWARDEENIELI